MGRHAESTRPWLTCQSPTRHADCNGCFFCFTRLSHDRPVRPLPINNPPDKDPRGSPVDRFVRRSSRMGGRITVLRTCGSSPRWRPVIRGLAASSFDSFDRQAGTFGAGGADANEWGSMKLFHIAKTMGDGTLQVLHHVERSSRPCARSEGVRPQKK